MEFHGYYTPRNWGIALNIAWFKSTIEAGIQVGPFNVFVTIGDN
jgi:hypothetical protein